MTQKSKPVVCGDSCYCDPEVSYDRILRLDFMGRSVYVRGQANYAGTVIGSFAHETATVRHPVAYPPRHPATNIGE